MIQEPREVMIKGKMHTVQHSSDPQDVGKKFSGFMGRNSRNKIRPTVPTVSKIREMANPKARPDVSLGTPTRPGLGCPAHYENLPEAIRDFIEYAIKPSSMYQTIPKYYNLGF